MFNINELRNRTIDVTVNLLNKAKAKPPTLGTQLRELIDDPEISLHDKLSALNFLLDEIKEAQE